MSVRAAVDKATSDAGKRERSASKTRRAETEATLATLDARITSIESDYDGDRQSVIETIDEVADLKAQVGEMRRDNAALRESVERLSKELNASAAQPIAELRKELHTAVTEASELKAQVAVMQHQLAASQRAQQEAATQLKDVAVLRAQQGFVQAAADRADLATTEITRLLGEVRSELAGLQQRHAALASSAVAENGSHRSAHAQLRSSAETLALQFESLQAEMGGLRSNDAVNGETCEKLKKAAKRHELLLHRLTEVQEARAGELRQLIKTLADQIKPLHDTSRRHASQIEEVSSGINVMAELLRFTNRNRTQTLADALHAT